MSPHTEGLLREQMAGSLVHTLAWGPWWFSEDDGAIVHRSDGRSRFIRLDLLHGGEARLAVLTSLARLSWWDEPTERGLEGILASLLQAGVIRA